MNDQKNRDAMKRFAELVDKSGMLKVEEVTGGARLCCRDPDNIKLASIPVGKDFRIKDHLDNALSGSLKASCKVCGTKWWVDKNKGAMVART